MDTQYKSRFRLEYREKTLPYMTPKGTFKSQQIKAFPWVLKVYYYIPGSHYKNYITLPSLAGSLLEKVRKFAKIRKIRYHFILGRNGGIYFSFKTEKDAMFIILGCMD
jgi:hypothetical protein